MSKKIAVQGTAGSSRVCWLMMPNGFEEHRIERTPPVERQEGSSYAIHVEEKANYVEGLVHGAINASWVMDYAETHI